MHDGPNAPVVDLLTDLRYELLVLNDQMRELRGLNGREIPAPIVEVLPAPVVVHPSEPAAPFSVDMSALVGTLQGLGNSEVVNALGEMRKDLTDLAGVMRAMGMGNASYGGGGGPSHVTAEVYSKDGLTVKTEESAKDARYEFQTVAAERKPLYIGIALPGSLASAEVWSIQKYTYSGSDLSLVQTRSGSWDNRVNLF